MQTQFLAAGTGMNNIIVDSAAFDASYLSMTSLTGLSDSKAGLLSCFVYPTNTTGEIFYIGTGIFTSDFVLGYSNNAFGYTGRNSDVNLPFGNGDNILIVQSSQSYPPNTWYHVIASWDLAITTTHLYINGVSDKATLDFSINDTIDWGSEKTEVGAIETSNIFPGNIAEFYFTNTYLDLSIPANRRKFATPGNRPVYLGTTGSVATGTAPLIYLHLADGETAANFATNRGTGGDFTVNGSLSTGSTSPSD